MGLVNNIFVWKTYMTYCNRTTFLRNQMKMFEELAQYLTLLFKCCVLLSLWLTDQMFHCWVIFLYWHNGYFCQPQGAFSGDCDMYVCSGFCDGDVAAVGFIGLDMHPHALFSHLTEWNPRCTEFSGTSSPFYINHRYNMKSIINQMINLHVEAVLYSTEVGWW